MGLFLIYYVMTPKYSKTPFEGYTHRFKVEFLLRNEIQTSIDIYSDCELHSRMHQFIEENKSNKVFAYEIIHKASKEQDDMTSKFIDEILNGF